jgi:hAT family C-terminal dimerisation region
MNQTITNLLTSEMAVNMQDEELIWYEKGIFAYFEFEYDKINEVTTAAASTESEEDKFLSESVNTEAATPVSNDISSECASYLSNTRKDVDMLQAFPNVMKVFVKYNTILPSSAAVERLFSAASIILCKRRNKLADETFEKLLLLRQNKRTSIYECSEQQSL